MKYKKIAVSAVWAAAILIASAITIWDFSVQLQNALTRETYQTLEEVSVDYNKAFLDRISYHTKTMKVLASSLQEMEGRTEQDVMRILQNAAEDGGFTQTAVCNAKGECLSQDGSFGCISDREYFQKAMRGEANVSQPLQSGIDGTKSIVIAVPIHSREKVTGVLFGIYPLSTAGDKLLNFTYYSEGYGFVVAPDGTIILSGEHTDRLANEDNLFAFFEKAHLVHFSMAELREAVKNGESRSFEFTYQGARRFVNFMPSQVNDWYTFSLSSDAPMLRQEQITKQMMLRLVLRLIMGGVLLFAWVSLHNRRHNREIMAASQRYQSLLAHINGGMIVAHHATSADETIATYVSPGFTDMTGYTLEDIQTTYQGST